MQYIDINMHISGRVSLSNFTKIMAMVEEHPIVSTGSLSVGKDNPVMPEVEASAKIEDKPKRQPKSKEEAPAEKTEEQTETPADDVPSLDDVRAAAQKLVAANGREALAERLEKYGAANLSALPADKRAEFITSVE